MHIGGLFHQSGQLTPGGSEAGVSAPRARLSNQDLARIVRLDWRIPSLSCPRCVQKLVMNSADSSSLSKIHLEASDGIVVPAGVTRSLTHSRSTVSPLVCVPLSNHVWRPHGAYLVRGGGLHPPSSQRGWGDDPSMRRESQLNLEEVGKGKCTHFSCLFPLFELLTIYSKCERDRGAGKKSNSKVHPRFF